MQQSFSAPVSAAIVAALSASLSAQWPLYPASNVSKVPDGKPDLTAPAPRTADGRPDLSGVWMRQENPEPNGSRAVELGRSAISTAQRSNCTARR